MDKADVQAMVNAAVKEAIAPAVKDAVTSAVTEALKVNALSDDDKAALADAKKAREDRKADLVARIVANTTITKEVADKMDFATLETVANGLLPVASYGGRAAPAAGNADDPAVKAMSEHSGGVVALIQARAKGKAA